MLLFLCKQNLAAFKIMVQMAYPYQLFVPRNTKYPFLWLATIKTQIL